MKSKKDQYRRSFSHTTTFPENLFSLWSTKGKKLQKPSAYLCSIFFLVHCCTNLDISLLCATTFLPLLCDWKKSCASALITHFEGKEETAWKGDTKLSSDGEKCSLIWWDALVLSLETAVQNVLCSVFGRDFLPSTYYH